MSATTRQNHQNSPNTDNYVSHDATIFLSGRKGTTFFAHVQEKN
jgi:hypothetical protein